MTALNDELRLLAERLEAATGPDRELDAAIAWELKIGPRGRAWPQVTQRYLDKWPEADPVRSNHFVSEGGPDGSFGWSAVKFTASIDAAKTLWPAKVPHLIPSDPRICTAAALRARASIEGGK